MQDKTAPTSPEHFRPGDRVLVLGRSPGHVTDNQTAPGLVPVQTEDGETWGYLPGLLTRAPARRGEGDGT